METPTTNAPSAVPIYERLVAAYTQAILSHEFEPGAMIDSITQIQKKYNVARETAKRVLNILEERGYIVQRVGKGSFVLERGPKQKVWGVVVPFFSVAYEDLLARVTQLASPLGREVRRFYDYHSWQEEIRLVGMMQRDRYEAVVVIPTFDEPLAWSFYSKMSVHDSPVVLFDHTMTYRNFHFVVQSYDLGVVRALDYLLSVIAGDGVAFVHNEGWGGRNLVLELMVETYRMVLRRHCPDREPLILHGASAVDAASLQRQGVRGIFCCDDVSAIQVLGRLRDQGVRVPNDMRLVSYGNTDLARFFTPAISSVDPHHDEMAQELVKLLMGLANYEGTVAPRTPERQYVVQPDLVVRET